MGGTSPVSALIRGAAVAALLVTLSTWAADALESKTLAAPKPLASFNLQDHEGRPFSNEQFQGRWSLVMLGFTHCPDVCPFTLQNLALVVEQMSTLVPPDRLPQVVFLAVDPHRDKPLLADYVRHFNDGFVGITGGLDDVKKLVDSLEGFVRIAGKQGSSAGYQVQHSAIVSVIDPRGRIRATLNPPMEPRAAADFVTDLMRRAATEAK